MYQDIIDVHSIKGTSAGDQLCRVSRDGLPEDVRLLLVEQDCDGRQGGQGRGN